ncbi:MAG: cupin domain-containing protein [Solirubrobacterales bacterium]
MDELTGAGIEPVEPTDHVEWVEHLRRRDMSVGTYSIPVGGRDDQDVHTEDEVYVVTSGVAVLTGPDKSIPVKAGSVIFVPANEEHRFVDVTEALTVLVVFAPAEYSRDPDQD